jgi:hypothetical protein
LLNFICTSALPQVAADFINGCPNLAHLELKITTQKGWDWTTLDYSPSIKTLIMSEPYGNDQKLAGCRSSYDNLIGAFQKCPGLKSIHQADLYPHCRRESIALRRAEYSPIAMSSNLEYFRAPHMTPTAYLRNVRELEINLQFVDTMQELTRAVPELRRLEKLTINLSEVNLSTTNNISDLLAHLFNAVGRNSHIRHLVVKNVFDELNEIVEPADERVIELLLSLPVSFSLIIFKNVVIRHNQS